MKNYIDKFHQGNMAERHSTSIAMISTYIKLNTEQKYKNIYFVQGKVY